MRGLEPALLGNIIERIDVRRRDMRVPIPDDFEETLSGERVEGIKRRGKYMIVTLSDGRAVIWHLGMSGRVAIVPLGEEHIEEKHDHVVLHIKGGTRIVFNDARRFGLMTLSMAEGWEAEKPFCLMGPEPLGNGFSGEVLAERLAGRKTSIKVALLDQRIVVGVGNIYACEALYRAGISPFARAGSIKGARADDLVSAIVTILKEAIEAGGSTLKDHRQTDGSLGYFQHQFFVYDQMGEHCGAETCAKLGQGCIERVQQAGRSTFYCPNQQREA